MNQRQVTQVIAAAEGPTRALKYNGGEMCIVVPRQPVVVTCLPGSVNELKAGALTFGPAASRRYAANPVGDGGRDSTTAARN
jgi:hypothetical protein